MMSSSGEEWIKTECGWKLLPIHPEVLVEVGSSSASSRTGCTKINEPADGTTSSKLECCSAPEENEKISKQQKELNMMLHQRCVSAMPSTKESSHYSTISDAVNKLNFEQALNNDGCFPFICQVIAQLFRKPQCTLSGSMQNTLLKLIGKAKDISIASESATEYSARVLEMISSGILWFEKLQKEQFTSYSVRNIDTKIRTLLTMKEQLNEHLASLKDQTSSTAQLELDDLPVDCIQHIAKYLTHPRDLLNLGATNILHEITEGNHIWRGLTVFHYGHHVKPDSASIRWKNLFMKHYREGTVKFERVIYGQSDAVRLCEKCNFVFWKAYSHPCATVRSSQPRHHVIARKEEQKPVKHDPLTPEQFLLLFVF
ncbi:F-box only protein 32-like isoform X2 [Halichondria panicea]|uniref:F-box only protein 32-like isoform X2 n=1 Tax=Halichondria panicea TaxID=6063 RepID=UPI00312BAAD9